MDSRFPQHPLRARVLGELHARPFAPVRVPARLVHFGFMTDGEHAGAAREALVRFCEGMGVEAPAAGARHHRVAFSGMVLRWESHSEFTTYTWEESPADPYRLEAPPEAAVSAMLQIAPPGDLIVAADLRLVEGPRSPAEIERLFGTEQVAISEVEGGAAVIATDFRTDPLGFVRIHVAGQDLTEAQAGALVQRLLEVETYRTLALLGLPEAQALGPSIRRIEGELPVLLDAMQADADIEASHRALDRLTALAAELERGAASSLFRFGATRAYDELVRLRLEALGEHAIAGHVGWSAFLARRLNPAIRTCISTEERQANLSRKLARAAQLLRTRVEVDLERQNRDQLRVMNDRLHLQLRLQQTVEGLSIAAISYYVASLLHLVLEGAHGAGLHLDPTVGTAAAVPVIVLAVAWLVGRIRRRHADVRRTASEPGSGAA